VAAGNAYVENLDFYILYHGMTIIFPCHIEKNNFLFKYKKLYQVTIPIITNESS